MTRADVALVSLAVPSIPRSRPSRRSAPAPSGRPRQRSAHETDIVGVRRAVDGPLRPVDRRAAPGAGVRRSGDRRARARRPAHRPSPSSAGRRRPPRRRTRRWPPRRPGASCASGQTESLTEPARRRGGLPGRLPRRLAAGAPRRAPQRGAAGRRHPDRAGRRRGDRRRAAPSPLASWLDDAAARQQVLREVEGDPGHRGPPGRSTPWRRPRGSPAPRYLVLAGTGAPPRPGLGPGGGSVDHPPPAGAHRRRRPPRRPSGCPSSSTRSAAGRRRRATWPPRSSRSRCRTDDELGHLAHAFNAVQSVAVDVAAEQATAAQEGHQRPVREPRPPQPGAHRSPDPAARPARGARSRTRRCSQHLYLLDHLATRMRRNAESLLDPGGLRVRAAPVEADRGRRRRAAPRSARSRSTSGSSWARWPPPPCTAPPVSDVAHLVAELLENATQFSPPDSTVRVDGAARRPAATSS